MWSKRIQDLIAMMAAGDGVLALVQPRHHMAVWRGHRPWSKRAMRPFVEHPQLARALGGLELALAMLWVRRLA